jgi:hypothetical protein
MKRAIIRGINGALVTFGDWLYCQMYVIQCQCYTDIILAFSEKYEILLLEMIYYNVDIFFTDPQQ